MAERQFALGRDDRIGQQRRRDKPVILAGVLVGRDGGIGIEHARAQIKFDITKRRLRQRRKRTITHSQKRFAFEHDTLNALGRHQSHRNLVEISRGQDGFVVSHANTVPQAAPTINIPYFVIGSKMTSIFFVPAGAMK